MRSASRRLPAWCAHALSFLLAIMAVETPDAWRAPALGEADRIRIAEAFRLADSLGDQLWPGWSSAPFAVLLVTPDQEFLVRHPKPTPEFTRLVDVAILGAPGLTRLSWKNLARARPSAFRAYLDAKRVFRKLVSPDDYPYFSFQLWQEGIARYTEYRMGELASAGYEPSPAVAALPDFTSYAAASRAIRDRMHAQLAAAALGDGGRSAFYPVGAAERILLDGK